MHYRQRWSNSITVKCLLVPIMVSHQVTQHLFRELDITAEWTGFDHSRMVVFVTGLAQIENAHQCSHPDCSGKPCIRAYTSDAVLVALVLESTGAGGHANSSNTALASFKSAVSNPS